MARTRDNHAAISVNPSNALQVDFPFGRLHPVAELESFRKEISRPVYHVHKWWANRLGSVFRTILLAGGLPVGADVWSRFYAHDNNLDIVVLDPFMGSGTTLGEAIKLGCRVVGCDINPISYFQVRKALSSISEARLRSAFTRLEHAVAPTIRKYYTASFEGTRAEILYTFWVMAVGCPKCNREVRLFSRYIFSSHAYPRKNPNSWAVCPACGEVAQGNYFQTSSRCSGCGLKFNPQAGPAQGQVAHCGDCAHSFKIVEVVRRTDHPPQYRMYALMLLTPDGRKVYKRTTEEDLALFDAASTELHNRTGAFPVVEIPPGVNTNQARGYNFRFWHQMFNDRQLLTLGTLLDGIMSEPDVEAREQLLLLFSGVLEFNNMFCSFKGEGTGAVRHLFSHHILKPERTPLEANPWGTDRSSGSFSTLFERRLVAARNYAINPFEIRACWQDGRLRGEKVFGINRPLTPRLAKSFNEIASGRADALVLCGNSAKLPLPDGSVDLVITDPPYFDNVHYSELADFFYCWLAKALRTSDPAFQGTTTRIHGEVQATSAEDFSASLGAVLRECTRVLKPGGTLAFTFHHSRAEAWVALATALRQARLLVVATHPVKAEMAVAVPKHQTKEPINLDLVVVCRHRAEIQSAAFDANRFPTEQVERLRSSGMELSRGDARVIVMGCFLRHATTVVDDDISGSTIQQFEKLVEVVFREQKKWQHGPSFPVALPASATWVRS